MRLQSLIFVAVLVATVPVFSQTPDPKAAQNASNWEVFEQFYPPRAIAAHEEGAVGFEVTLDRKGLVTDCKVTHSSGYPLLDQETCNVITLHAQFKPDPGLSPSQRRTNEGLIAWKLPGSKTNLSSPKALTAAEAPEKIICKSSIRTGTLAAVERTCMTAREWATQSENSKEPWDEMQGRKGSTKGD